MDQRQPPPPPPPPPLEESMRELTLEDGRPDCGAPASRSPESPMDPDDGGGARQHGNVEPPLHPRHTLFGGQAAEVRRWVPSPPPQQTVAAPPRVNAQARARDVEEILLEMLPEGSVLVGYTVNGYLFADS